MPIWKYFCVLCNQDISEWHKRGGQMKYGVCPPCSRLSVEQISYVPNLTLEDLMKTQEEWAGILQEKAAGILTVRELAEKHGVSPAAIYSQLNKGTHAKGKRVAAPLASRNGHSGTYSQVIADLTAKRDKLNAAISVLEELQAA